MEFFIAFFGVIYLIFKLGKESRNKSRFEKERDKYRFIDAKYEDEQVHHWACVFVRQHRDEAIEMVRKYLVITYDSENSLEYAKSHYKIPNDYIVGLLMAAKGKCETFITKRLRVSGQKEQIRYCYAVEKCFHDHGFPEVKYYHVPSFGYNPPDYDHGVIGGMMRMDSEAAKHPKARRLWDDTDSEICPVNWTDIDL